MKIELSEKIFSEATALDFSDQDLYDDSLVVITAMLQKYKQIIDINLSSNNFSESGIISFIGSLGKTSIVKLDISCSNLTAAAMKVLFEKMKMNLKLIHLDIGANKFLFSENSELTTSFLQMIASNHSLLYLGVGYSGINDNVFSKILSALKFNSKLKKLSLFNNEITDGSINFLIDYFSVKKSHAVNFDFKFTGITNNGVELLLNHLEANEIFISFNFSYTNLLDNIRTRLDSNLDANNNLQCKRINNFFEVVINFANQHKDNANQSYLLKLPKELLFVIIGMVRFTDSIDDEKGCAKFIFDNIDVFNAFRKNKQPFKMVERYNYNGISFFVEPKLVPQKNHSSQLLTTHNLTLG